jgi:hypothetical protein
MHLTRLSVSTTVTMAFQLVRSGATLSMTKTGKSWQSLLSGDP